MYKNIPTLLLHVCENLLDLQSRYFNFLFLVWCIKLYNLSTLTSILLSLLKHSLMMLSCITGNIYLHHKNI